MGLVLGLALAAGVAVYLARSGLTAPIPSTGIAKEALRSSPASGKPEALTQAAPEKPRFDFYKILPGAEEPRMARIDRAPERAGDRNGDKAIEAAKAADAAAKSADRFWLQAGAFASPAEAENLKAQLALSGWEAAILAAKLPDTSVRYRVRLGPYDNTDEVSKIKGELGKRGFDAAVIRNP